MMSDDGLLSSEVARRKGVSVDTVRRLRRQGILPSEKIGHVHVFRARDVERVFERRGRKRVATTD